MDYYPDSDYENWQVSPPTTTVTTTTTTPKPTTSVTEVTTTFRSTTSITSTEPSTTTTVFTKQENKSIVDVSVNDGRKQGKIYNFLCIFTIKKILHCLHFTFYTNKKIHSK